VKVLITHCLLLLENIQTICLSKWPHSLRLRSATARLLRLWVRIPPGAWMSVCCKCCLLSGRGLWDELITRPEESYRLWCDSVWSRNLVNEEALAHWGLLCQKQQQYRPYEVLLLLSYSFGSIVYHCLYGCMFCTLLFNFVCCVFLLLCMFRSGYCASLCCSVYFLCVNVYSTTATGYQPNCV